MAIAFVLPISCVLAPEFSCGWIPDAFGLSLGFFMYILCISLWFYM